MKKNRVFALILALLIALTAGLPALAEEAHIWKAGDTGERVSEIQARLQSLGYLKADPTGIFDEATEQALTAFQREHGLLATGMGDERTLSLLFSEAE